ncbi:hypothetical protein KIPB_010024, partial [Kipferlia bialata]|eukprot:g10024.t1
MSSFEDLLNPVYERSDARWLVPLDEGFDIIDRITQQCEESGTRYVDHAFPCCDKSINRVPE